MVFRLVSRTSPLCPHPYTSYRKGDDESRMPRRSDGYLLGHQNESSKTVEKSNTTERDGEATW